MGRNSEELCTIYRKGKVVIAFSGNLFVFYQQYQENKEQGNKTTIQDFLFSKKCQQHYLIRK